LGLKLLTRLLLITYTFLQRLLFSEARRSSVVEAAAPRNIKSWHIISNRNNQMRPENYYRNWDQHDRSPVQSGIPLCLKGAFTSGIAFQAHNATKTKSLLTSASRSIPNGTDNTADRRRSAMSTANAEATIWLLLRAQYARIGDVTIGGRIPPAP
jgi:hypothetical protein